jgi:eukaryotic-like serine/threonine-protein kinase
MTGTDYPLEFDGYRLIQPIGAGGMGQVFLGHDTLLDRPVAVKFIASSRALDAEARRRFLVEARAVARLQHPCVVTVYRAGEIDGHPYLISEFVEGKSLDRLKIPVPIKELIRIADDLSRGLTVAHRAGIIHRDIKPANAIVARDGKAKLLDFGIARLLEPGQPTSDVVPDADTKPLPPLDLPTVAVPLPDRLDPKVSTIIAVPLPDQLEAEVSTTVAVNLPDHLHPGLSSPALTPSKVFLADVLSPEGTRPGRVVGTPGYMAPEIWRGCTATFAADIYSLGALLFALCTGRPPHYASTLEELRHSVLAEDAPPLSSVAPLVPAPFAAIVDRCLRRQPKDRFPTADAVRAALVPLSSPAASQALPEGNPYRGLRHFEVSHQAYFFGRDAEIRAVLDRLQTDPVVIVTGDSGVGKSSLCRAGVLSRAAEWLSGELSWSVVTAVPGRRPLQAICAALSNISSVPVEELVAALSEGVSPLSRRLRTALAPDSRGIVLFIDQLEELVTLADPKEASLVAPLLGWNESPAPGFRIVSTVRGDFLGRLSTLPRLGDSFTRFLYFLRPLSRERIREAVTGPAMATGLAFQNDELVDSLVETTVAAGGGGLPLLQFALQKLWEGRDVEGKLIPASALKEMGGVDGALSLHADELLTRLGPRSTGNVRKLFLQLISAEGTRIRRTGPELSGDDPQLLKTLDSLVQGRLVIALESPDGPLYEVAHEALLSGWGTLIRWLNEDIASRAAHARLRAACEEWQRLSRSNDALWSGSQLEEARAIAEVELSPDESAFLALSRRALRRGRLKRRVALVAVLLTVLGTYGGMHLKASMETAQLVSIRVASGVAAMGRAQTLLNKLDAAESLSFAAFDRRNPQLGEAAWTVAGKIRLKYQIALGEAGRELETAVALDPSKSTARMAFAELLLARATEADMRGATAARDEFLLRMGLYDDGTMAARWNLPARLSVTTDDAVTTDDESARLALIRYEVDDLGQRLVEIPVPFPPRGPWTSLELPTGSYRIAIEGAAGSVRLPFVVSRGEHLSLHVPTAPLKNTPNDFVYVPAGRFRFGSGESDGLRKGFHHTVPLHTVSVGEYFIARHETTFGQWLQYVDAASEEIRKRRLPAVHAGGFEGALSLTKSDRGEWQLDIKPTATAYRAVAGQKVVYPGRTRRREQDWLRFPVVGITASQAADYAAWLSQSGRVPGARLCDDREWEFAARGADGREYPHGHFMNPDDANFDATYAKDPTAMGLDEVGEHPASDSPFGIADLSGNVWEWTTSSVEPTGHAARGGSYYFDINSARTSNRETPEPSFRDTSVGFRVCADIPSSPLD